MISGKSYGGDFSLPLFPGKLRFPHTSLINFVWDKGSWRRDQGKGCFSVGWMHQQGINSSSMKISLVQRDLDARSKDGTFFETDVFYIDGGRSVGLSPMARLIPR
jgi:hypothetical protein